MTLGIKNVSMSIYDDYRNNKFNFLASAIGTAQKQVGSLFLELQACELPHINWAAYAGPNNLVLVFDYTQPKKGQEAMPEITTMQSKEFVKQYNEHFYYDGSHSIKGDPGETLVARLDSVLCGYTLLGVAQKTHAMLKQIEDILAKAKEVPAETK